jgi:hypothetical protein
MNIKKLEEVLAEMRAANNPGEAQLRSWETRIAEAITDDLMAQIGASIGATSLASEPGGHDWE